MAKRLSITILLSLIGLPLLSSCTTTSSTKQPAQTSIATKQEIDLAQLAQMNEAVEALDLPLDSVVVLHQRETVFESYPNFAYDADDMHLLYSVTKSVTSALIGIAIEEGFIEGVDQKVVDFFPDMTIENLDSRKENLTIEDLLTMSCGFEWEGPDDRLHTWGEAVKSHDPVQYVLNLPMATEPGSVWQYNGGCSHLLSAILTRSTGMTTLQFARQFLFEPLGITKVKWPIDPQGIYYGGQDIWLTPRDMAKFGQLYLNDGVWEGEQIIPAGWVADSSRTHISQWVGGYGYQWWTYPQSGIYYAAGAFEQRIAVIPALDLVVVFTADNKLDGLAPGEMQSAPPFVDWLTGRFILPALTEQAQWEYTDYGFSLMVPLGMQEQVYGKSWQGSASENSGLVQFQYNSSPFENTGVQWESVESAPNLENVLKEFGDVLSGLGLEVTTDGQFVPATMGDHELVYQGLGIKDGTNEYSAVIGAWYCDHAQRVYLLYFATALPDVVDPLAEFQRYVDSFTCH